MGGLLSPLGDVLLGQDLAQPGVLVVHESLPFLQVSCFPGDLDALGCRWPAQDGAAVSAPNPAPSIRRCSPAPYLWSLTPYGGRFALAGRGG